MSAPAYRSALIKPSSSVSLSQSVYSCCALTSGCACLQVSFTKRSGAEKPGVSREMEAGEPGSSVKEENDEMEQRDGETEKHQHEARFVVLEMDRRAEDPEAAPEETKLLQADNTERHRKTLT